jgi:hypothetical protein
MVSFTNFHTLDPDAADLSRELIDNAARQRSSFMSFMSIWMAFNGWMECVTEAPNDRRMIEMLADDRRATDAYEALLQGDSGFGRWVSSFADLWPVVNVRDARRKLGRDVFWRMDRDEFLEACRRREVKIAPTGWTGRDRPTWPQILGTIYTIRCNLFHGAKSPQNGRDRDLIRHADHVLRVFIEETGCLEWRD